MDFSRYLESGWCSRAWVIQERAITPSSTQRLLDPATTEADTAPVSSPKRQSHRGISLSESIESSKITDCDSPSARFTLDNEVHHLPPNFTLKRYKKTPRCQRQSSYLYTYLKAGEIRLLILKPAKSFNASIHCSVMTGPLSEMPEYEALSYTWGDAQQQKCVWLHGQRHRVTANLASFLRHRRKRSSTVVLWIDALCIDQGDVDERSVQVRLMRDIYLRACRLTIWLGPSRDGSDEALECFHALGLEERWEKMPTLPPRIIEAMALLLDRDWWQRTWVVQEVALGGARGKYFATTVRCGDTTIRWPLLERAADRMSLHNEEQRQQYRYVERVTVFEHQRRAVRASLQPKWAWIYQQLEQRTASLNALAFQNRGPVDGLQYEDHQDKEFMEDRLRAIGTGESTTSLLDNLANYRHLKASDPRDKIFGFMGISHDILVDSVVPDYTKSVQSIYCQFASDFIRLTGNLNILRHCGCPSLSDLPSWVPDWSVPNSLHALLPLIQQGTANNEGKDKEEETQPQHINSWYHSLNPMFVHSKGQLCGIRGNHLEDHGYILDTVRRTRNPFVASLDTDWEASTHFMIEVGRCKHMVLHDEAARARWGTTKRLHEAFWQSFDDLKLDKQGKGLAMEDLLPEIPSHWKPSEPRLTEISSGRLRVAVFSAWVAEEHADLGPVALGAGMGLDLLPKEWNDHDKKHYRQRFRYLADLWANEPYDLHQRAISLPFVVPDPFLSQRARSVRSVKPPDLGFSLSHRFTEGRRFFISLTGHMGVGPPAMQKGDKIALLIGVEVPLILREKPGGIYEVIGEAHVSKLANTNNLEDMLTHENCSTITLV